MFLISKGSLESIGLDYWSINSLLAQSISQKKSKVCFPQFDILEAYGKELEKSIIPKDVVPGLSVYGMFTALRSDQMGKGVILLCWLDHAHYFHSKGFRVFYTRTSHIKSFHLLSSNGGYRPAKIKGVENGK